MSRSRRRSGCRRSRQDQTGTRRLLAREPHRQGDLGEAACSHFRPLYVVTSGQASCPREGTWSHWRSWHSRTRCQLVMASVRAVKSSLLATLENKVGLYPRKLGLTPPFSPFLVNSSSLSCCVCLSESQDPAWQHDKSNYRKN